MAGGHLSRLYRIALCLVVGMCGLSDIRAQQPVAFEQQRTALLEVFLAELGVNDRHTISNYLAYTKLSYGHEWCAAFVSWCFGQLGYVEPRTPWSPSLFPKQRRVWERARASPKTVILPGMVWGIHIHAKGRIGHVGFVEKEHNGVITTVEGNTGPPEGKGPNGVYRKRRSLRTISVIADWL